MSEDLDPISPERAVSLYFEARQDELADQTVKSQRYRLDAFLEWCNEEEIENLNEVGGRDIVAYRVWRREGRGEDRDEVTTTTLRGQMATLRAFMKFAADIDAVGGDVFSSVSLPIAGGGDVSETTLEPDRAIAILDYLERYEYASRRHVSLLLMWHTGARVGAIRGLDLRDCELEDENPGIEFNHRASADTPLKNAEKGERWNAISERVARVLQDYIDGPRLDMTDEYSRRPLVTTEYGRPSVSTLRDNLYAVTRPCWRGLDCPHDRDPEECEATEYSKASTCPSSRSPHDVRSGRVTAYRRADIPRRIVSDRLDASKDILDKHYDRRREREKAEQRREYLPDN